jgi:hypothetical protein
MENDRKPIGNPMTVGRVAYQLYSRRWQGRVKYSAKVGKVYVSKETGQVALIPEFEDYTADDFSHAVSLAKTELVQLTQAAFQQHLSRKAGPSQAFSKRQTDR